MSTLPLIGWREWIRLPDLGLHKIKAKVDTGARTSALHAYYIEPYTREGVAWVEFGVHPLQGRYDVSVVCHAPVFDERVVTDSGGHKETRYVIQTNLQLGEARYAIDITLTNRDMMKFRFLLGRTSIPRETLINPSASFLLGRRYREKVYEGEKNKRKRID